MKIGIRFPDSYYHNTIFHIMNSLLLAITWNHDIEETLYSKEKIVEIFNLIAYPTYVIYQNRYTIDPTRASYLQITIDNIYLGQEAMDYITLYDHWDSHEFYMLDTETNKIIQY